MKTVCTGGLLLAAALAAGPVAAWDHPTVRVFGAPPAQPPWMDEKPIRVAPNGYWRPREVDWHIADWNAPQWGNAIHRHTQAHSLWFERKYVIPAEPSRQPFHWIGIPEYVPTARVCGPGIR